MSASLIIILLVILLIYKNHFNGEISSDHSRWSQFGDFINGVISPIFTAINIGIFWYLTKVIEDKNEQRQREVQENEDRRQDQNAEHEKALIKMQFRKAEIDKLEEILRNVVVPEKENNNDDYSPETHAATRASVYILNFLQTELDLFGLKASDKTAKNLGKLNDTLNELCENLKKASTAEALLDDEDIDMSDLDKTYTEYLRLKGSIIADLQNITLGEKKS